MCTKLQNTHVVLLLLSDTDLLKWPSFSELLLAKKAASHRSKHFAHIFTVGCYSSMVLAVIVCPSVCPSHAGMMPKKDLGKSQTGSSQRGCQMQMG